MPSSFPLPSYPIPIHATPESRKRIAPGGSDTIYADGLKLHAPIVVDHSVVLSGNGNVTVSDTDEKVTRTKSTPHRPTEAKPEDIVKASEVGK
jgi:hypothetical protein